MNYTKIEKISKGWSSYIWLVKNKTGKILIMKEVREKSNRQNLAEREGKMLALANTIGIGPKLFEKNFEKNFVIMEFINGKKLLDFVSSKEFDNSSPKKIYFFVKELYKQCLLLDEIGLTHSQLQVGKNILVKKQFGKLLPIIIDFEKASIRKDKKEKNVGQIESFLFYNPNGFVAKKIRTKLNLEH
jgi:putative serine/threonine protein kinase